MRREMCEWVRDHIGHLPEKTREAMFLCYVEGLSIAEAARFLNARDGAVKKRLQYGRQLIGDKLLTEFGERAREARPPQKGEELSARVMAALPLGAAPWQIVPGAVTSSVATSLIAAKAVLVISIVAVAGAALTLFLFKSTQGEPAVLVSASAPAELSERGEPIDKKSGPDSTEDLPYDAAGRSELEVGDLSINVRYRAPWASGGGLLHPEFPVSDAELLLIPQRYDFAFFEKRCSDLELDRHELELLSHWYYRWPQEPDDRRAFLDALGPPRTEKNAPLKRRLRDIAETRIFGFSGLFPSAPSVTWTRARTNEDGQADVKGLESCRYLILLRQAGDARSWEDLTSLALKNDTPYAVAFVSPSESTQVKMRVDDWVSRVHGRVLDGETGEPIPGIELKIVGEATGGDEVVTSTKQDGTFLFLANWRVGYGPFRLELEPASPSLYTGTEPVESERKMGVPTPKILLELSKGALISGIVTDPDGTPLEGVHIQREYPDKRSAMTLATTDAQGRYRVKHDGGVYRIRAAAAFWVDIVAEETVARTDWAELELAPGQSVVQDFVFPSTGRLVLKFVFPDSTSVPEGVFRGQVVKYGSTIEVQPAGYTKGLDNGKIVIPYLTPGRYEVEARVDGYDPVMLDNLVIGTDGGDTETTVTLITSTLRQKVRVLHASGRPWPGVHVGAHEYYPFNAAGGELIPSNNLSSLTGGKTDRNGEYVLENLWEGMFRIAAYDQRLPKYGLGVMVELPHDDPIILQPEVEQPRVHYAVKPIDLASGASVNIEHHSAQVFAIGEQGHLEDGPATNGVNLPEGAHLVVFVKPGYTAAMEWVEAAPARFPWRQHEIELQLTEGGSVYGVVETAAGEPLSGQALLVYPAEIWDLAQWDSESWQRLGRALAQGVTSDEAGEFDLRFLPTGTYIVACDEHTFGEPVEVHDGYQTGSVTITKDE
jgi:hypothetical protein